MRIEILDLRGFEFSLKRQETRDKRQETRRIKPAVVTLVSTSAAVLVLISIRRSSRLLGSRVHWQNIPDM
jgi:hypothetical protein